MGAVFEAVDEKTGKLVAVKIMRPEFARNREALTRFLNEARAANLIEHPSIVQVLSDGRLPDGTANIVNFIGTASPGASNYAATYTGPVLVSGGVLRVTGDSALGTDAGGTTVNGGTALELFGSFTEIGEALKHTS